MTTLSSTERRAPFDPRTDGQIVAALLSGHSELFEVLMRRYNQRLYRTLRIWSRDENLFFSLMQQVYVQAYSRLSRLADPENFGVSLLQHGAGLAQSQCRRRLSIGLTIFSLQRKPPAKTDPESTQPLHTPLKSVEQCIDALPTATRAVFMLTEVEGLEPRQVAETLTLSTKTVHLRLERAHRKIKRLLPTELNALVPKTFRLPPALGERVVQTVAANVAPDQTLITPFEPTP